MFTIEIQEENVVSLCYKQGQVEFSFCPENTNGILDLTKDDDYTQGEFSNEAGNGHCSFEWNEKTISFEVAKYGDGEGGHLVIRVDNNPETMSSLKDCLNKWREIAENIKEEEEY